MNQYIGIGMAQGTFFMGNLNTTQPEGDSFLQPVHIVSETDPESHASFLEVKSQRKPEGIGQGTVLPVGGYQVGEVQGKYIQLESDPHGKIFPVSFGGMLVEITGTDGKLVPVPVFNTQTVGNFMKLFLRHAVLPSSRSTPGAS